MRVPGRNVLGRADLDVQREFIRMDSDQDFAEWGRCGRVLRAARRAASKLVRGRKWTPEVPQVSL